MSLKAFAFAAALLPALALAAPTGSVTDVIGEKIRARTGMQVDEIRVMPGGHLVEVVVGRRLFYTDPDVQYLFVGKIFDTVQQADLTTPRLEELAKVRWDRFDMKDAIKVVYGNGERKVIVFTDANCHYCRILEQNLRAVSNVTVYNFLYPILNSESVTRDIYCAKDPSKVWQEHMFSQAMPPKAPAACKAPQLARNTAQGRKLGLTGTPAIIFPDGTLVSGALPVDQLENALRETAQAH